LWSYAAHIIVVATVLCTQVDGYLVKCNGTTIYAYKNIKCVDPIFGRKNKHE